MEKAKISGNNKYQIDCSSYVSWVLYEYKYKKIVKQINSSGFNDDLIETYGWTKITGNKKDATILRSQLVGGELLVDPGEHIEIYMGNGKSYSCGNSDGDGKYNAGPAHISDTNFTRYSYAIRIK